MEKTESDWDPRSAETLHDQRAVYDQMREQCPVAYSDFLQWSLFRHEDVLRVINDHLTFSNAVSRHLSVPNGMDPPEHTPYRRIIEPYFSPERMAAFEPVCRELAVDLVCGALASGQLELMAELAVPFAAHAQCAFLGWPPSLYAPLIRWTHNNYHATLARDRQALAELARQFEGYIDELLDERLQAGAGPERDLTAALLHETIAGRPLSNEEIASLLRNWTVGEIGTLSAAIGSLVHFLAIHPQWQDRLRAEPALIPQAVEEILRIDGPLATNRRVTTCPVEIGGRQIAAGEQVTLHWIAANRDERAFEEPQTFQLDRDQANNLLWGAGIHVCPGAPLARLEMRVCLEELLQRSARIQLDQEKSPIRGVYPACGFATLPVQIQ